MQSARVRKMMFPLDLENLLTLTGLLFGIMFGFICGISKEEKVKYTAITVFETETTLTLIDY